MNGNESIVDFDSHVADGDPALWEDYLPASQKHLAPRIVTDSDGTERIMVTDRLFPKPSGPGRGSPLGTAVTRATVSLEERLQYIQRVGIGHAFLQPGFVGLAALTTPRPDLRRALIQAHNRLVCSMDVAAEGLHASIAVSMTEPEWSVTEIERCGREINVLSVVTRPTSDVARPLRDAATNPLLLYLIERAMPLTLHTATGYYQFSPGADLFDDYVFTHSLSHPVEQMVALTDLIGSGVLAKGLRVVALEGGCGWFPWLLDRLAAHFAHTGGCDPVDINPHDLARTNILLGVEPDDPGIPYVVERIGADVLTFASDFPHWDAVSEESIHEIPKMYGSDVAGKIMGANARRMIPSLD